MRIYVHSMNSTGAIDAPTEPPNLPPPRSAWLLLGDEASFPPIGLNRDSGTQPWSWTACPHVEIGDSLFFYYVSPRKAVHFLGRAVSRPHVAPGREVNSTRDVDTHQWWVDYNALVEIAPIPLQEINRACGERLVLRGKSGRHIRTEAANQLLQHASIVHLPEAWCGRLALQRVMGRSELPAPAKMNLKTLRALPASLLRLESDVEEYVVEPLFRLLRLPRPYRLQRRLRIRRKVADYAVFNGAEPQCIVEVKLRTALDRHRNWAESPDIQQAEGYANSFGIRFVLIDCDEVFCFDAGSLVPRLHFELRNLTAQDLPAIRSFVLENE